MASVSITILKRHLQDFRKLLSLPASRPKSVHRFNPKQSVLVLSPHPDDEILMGALALRLQTENKMKVVNVAVTMGSNKERQKVRRVELTKATKLLKWDNVILADDWSKKKSQLAALLKKHKPVLVIAPHVNDRHPTHEQTAQLLLSCLKSCDTTVAWAEYWNVQNNPNCLVEVPDAEHLRQVSALECHKGEIERNPYHLRLLGWQMDTVRRGSEWLAQKGAPSVTMLAGQLYRLEKWHNGKAVRSFKPAPFAHATDDLTDWLQ